MNSEIFDTLWLVLLLVGLFYLGAPIVLRFQQRYPAHPDLLPLGFDSLDPKVRQFLTSRSKEVLRLGFGEPTLVRVVNAAPNVVSYLVMLINRERGDRAMVTFIVGTGLKTLHASYVEFSTRFESGLVFNTHNARTLPAFAPAPQATRTQTPSVRDPEELYRLHQFVMTRAEAEGAKVMYDPGKALDYLIEYAFIKMYDTQVARGLLHYCPDEDAYRPTFWGAYRLAWGLLPPLKWIQQLLLIRRERTVLREFRQTLQETAAPEADRPGGN
jgi:hypothetical protein